jgi:hypothetical protein
MGFSLLDLGVGTNNASPITAPHNTIIPIKIRSAYFI